MPHSIHQERPTRLPRARLIAAAALVSGVVVAGCGGSAPSPTVPNVGGGTTAAASAAAAGPAGIAGSSAGGSSSGGSSAGGSSTGGSSTGGDAASSGSAAPNGLAFARCMRANGVPNFPDPAAGRGLLFSSSGLNPAAPAFKAAQAKCHKLLPAGPPGPGSTTHPSPQTLAKLLRISRCMREHGVPQFPDPRTSVPSNVSPGQYPEITDFDGAILLFPGTINLQSPAYRQALTACGAPPLGLPH